MYRFYETILNCMGIIMYPMWHIIQLGSLSKYVVQRVYSVCLAKLLVVLRDCCIFCLVLKKKSVIGQCICFVSSCMYIEMNLRFIFVFVCIKLMVVVV